MPLQKISVTFRRYILFLLIFLIMSVRGTYAQTPECVPSAPDGYTGKACVVTIDRDNPASPTTLVVRGETSVTIRVKNARWNESVTFTPVTTRVTDVDVAGTFLRSAINPLQGLVIAQKAHGGHFVKVIDPIGDEQQKIMDRLNYASTVFANATTELTCLEKYKVLDKSNPQYVCSPNVNLDAASFQAAKEETLAKMDEAATTPLPIAENQIVSAKVAEEVKATIAMPGGSAKSSALERADKYLSNQAILNALITDAQTTQKTMLETMEQLSNLPGAAAEATYTIKQLPRYNSTITVTAIEIISKTSTTLASVTISWQSNQWEVSTGILFSNVVARSYTNAPLIVGGQPVRDSSGKVLTVVTESDTSPSIVFPMVMGNYRIRRLSHAKWENTWCPNHCAFLISGGVGANLTSKTAEFAVGPSFQIGQVLLTPAAHFGRESILTSGVTVGSQLGSSPPSPLPTKNRWVARFGFAISYVLPFQ